MPSDKNQPTSHVTFDSPTHETPQELAKVQDMLTEMSKTMAEHSKSVTEQTKLGQKALAELKDKQGAAANVVHSDGKYGRRKGDSKGGGKGKGKTGKMEFPANTMCDYVDQGRVCPLHDTPEGCPHLHPEDGMEANREKRNAQEEIMKTKQD